MPASLLRRIPFLLVVTGLCSVPAASPQEPAPRRYVVTPLAPGQPLRMNDAGEIAGSVQVTDGSISRGHAAVYRNGTWLDLGVLEDDRSSYAADINNHGVLVGESERIVNAYEARQRAIIVEDGVMHPVEGLEGMDSWATAINDSGQICGRKGPLADSYPKPWHAFITRDGEVQDLHEAFEAAAGTALANTNANDINGRGDLVGHSDNDGFLYRNGEAIVLSAASLPGASPESIWSLYLPRAINDAGQVAGAASVIRDPTISLVLPALYDASANQLTLIPPPPGSSSSLGWANDLDAHGRVVGLQSVQWGTVAGFIAFLYENGETVDLNTVIPGDSQWVLENAMAINNNGQIAAEGLYQGKYATCLLTPSVLAAEGGIRELIESIEDLGLPKGMETSFLVKLRHALDALQAEDVASACAGLQAFINHAQAQAGKALRQEEASRIIAQAEAIRAILGCA